jgi:mRNA interferase HigB
MHVISNKPLREFAKRFPDAEKPLHAWCKLVEKSSFRNFAELKHAFNSVDRVGDLVVFDICGNKYRLIAYVRFDWQRCFVKHVLTHREYDEERWKQ